MLDSYTIFNLVVGCYQSHLGETRSTKRQDRIAIAQDLASVTAIECVGSG